MESLVTLPGTTSTACLPTYDSICTHAADCPTSQNDVAMLANTAFVSIASLHGVSLLSATASSSSAPCPLPTTSLQHAENIVSPDFDLAMLSSDVFVPNSRTAYTPLPSSLSYLLSPESSSDDTSLSFTASVIGQLSSLPDSLLSSSAHQAAGTFTIDTLLSDPHVERILSPPAEDASSIGCHLQATSSGLSVLLPAADDAVVLPPSSGVSIAPFPTEYGLHPTNLRLSPVSMEQRGSSACPPALAGSATSLLPAGDVTEFCFPPSSNATPVSTDLNLAATCEQLCFTASRSVTLGTDPDPALATASCCLGQYSPPVVVDSAASPEVHSPSDSGLCTVGDGTAVECNTLFDASALPLLTEVLSSAGVDPLPNDTALPAIAPLPHTGTGSHERAGSCPAIRTGISSDIGGDITSLSDFDLNELTAATSATNQSDVVSDGTMLTMMSSEMTTSEVPSSSSSSITSIAHAGLDYATECSVTTTALVKPILPALAKSPGMPSTGVPSPGSATSVASEQHERLDSVANAGASLRCLGEALTVFCQWEDCLGVFATQEELIHHLRSAHMPDKSASQSTPVTCKWFACPSYGQEKIPSRLRTHMRNHTGERPYKCKYCDKSFLRAEGLRVHKHTHTGDRPYPCLEPECYKTFANASDRNKHQRTHTVSRPYVCKMPTCGRSYTDPSSLRKHARRMGHRQTDIHNIASVAIAATLQSVANLDPLD